jgi:hypothetical protein
MLCAKCQDLFVGHTGPHIPRERWKATHNPLCSILCDRCGTVLPLLDPAEAMLSKLSQLSRFGIGADDRPILTSLQMRERPCVE